MILDAWVWCTGMTQRDGMGREEGRRFRMGKKKKKILQARIQQYVNQELPDV